MNRSFLATDLENNTLRDRNGLLQEQKHLSKVCLSNGESTGMAEIGVVAGIA